MKMRHGVVQLRNGTSVRISWDDAKGLIKELGNTRILHRPAASNFYVAEDPFDGSDILLDKNLICMIHMWTEGGLEENLSFWQHIRNRQKEYFDDDDDGPIPDDWGPGAF